MTDMSIPDQGGRDVNLAWVSMPLVMCDLEDFVPEDKENFFFPPMRILDVLHQRDNKDSGLALANRVASGYMWLFKIN